MNNKNLFNRKDLKSLRSSLRNRSTSAEVELWELIIELDGDSHGEYQKIQKDEIRDNYLANLGLINHPGRKQHLQYFDNHCDAATPPSKGGETFSRLSCKIPG